MHPRVCPHQVAFPNKSTTAFVDHCRGIGVQHMTLVTQLLMRPGGVKEAQRVLAGGGPRVATINHPFATFPNLESDTGEAAERLLRAIDNRVQRLNLARHLESVRWMDKDRLDIKANASPVGRRRGGLSPEGPTS